MPSRSLLTPSKGYASDSPLSALARDHRDAIKGALCHPACPIQRTRVDVSCVWIGQGAVSSNRTHSEISQVLLGGEAAFAMRAHTESAIVAAPGARLLAFRRTDLLPLLRILPGLRESIAGIPGSAQGQVDVIPLVRVDMTRQLLHECKWTNFIQSFADAKLP